MKRLHVDQLGRPVIGGDALQAPAWTRGEIEKPLGTGNLGGSSQTAVYTEEQQKRLHVNAIGQPVIGGDDAGLGPAWTRNEIEAPAGEESVGEAGVKIAVYT